MAAAFFLCKPTIDISMMLWYTGQVIETTAEDSMPDRMKEVVYLQLMEICERHGLTTSHTADLLMLAVESIQPDSESNDD